MENGRIASRGAGTDGDSSANEKALPDHELTTSAGPAAELDAMIERLRGRVAPALIAALMPSLADAAYNAEYERKGLSVGESPEYRPYCLSCSTMRRMEHRDYGYQCSVCGAKATGVA